MAKLNVSSSKLGPNSDTFDQSDHFWPTYSCFAIRRFANAGQINATTSTDFSPIWGPFAQLRQIVTEFDPPAVQYVIFLKTVVRFNPCPLLTSRRLATLARLPRSSNGDLGNLLSCTVLCGAVSEACSWRFFSTNAVPAQYQRSTSAIRDQYQCSSTCIVHVPSQCQ